MLETAVNYEPFVHAVLPRYGLHGATVSLLSFSENGVFLAETTDTKVIVRVHRPGYHSRQEVESELMWMDSIQTTSNIQTPDVRSALDGSKVAEVDLDGDVRLVDVLEFMPGLTADSEDAGISFEDLGALTAALHDQVQSWKPPRDFVRFRWDLDSMLGKNRRWGDWRDVPGVTLSHRELLGVAEEIVRQRLTAFGTGPDRFGLVHSDLRMSNVLVNNGSITVIDFDDCGWSWFLTDLAAVLTFIESTPEAPSIVRRWLTGYLTVRPLDDAAMAEIPTFVMLRRLTVLGWLGTHPESEVARSSLHEYIKDTVEMAFRYANDPDWFRFDVHALIASEGV